MTDENIDCGTDPGSTANVQPAIATSFPTGSHDARLSALDLIRGVAILGILPVHITIFSGPGMNPQQGGDGWLDHVLTGLTMLFFEGKMVTLLSMLFGAGLALQAGRAAVSGRRFTAYYARRMLVLFFIGLAHALFLFQWDILTSYALVGLAALWLSQREDVALMRTVAGCLAWCYGLVFLCIIVMIFAGPVIEPTDAQQPVGANTAQPSEGSSTAPAPLEIGNGLERFFSEENEIRIYRHGSFGEMILNRAVYLAMMAVLFWLETGWYLLACSLMGIWLIRRGVFHHVDSHRPLLHKLIGFGLALGVSFHAAALVAYARNPDGLLSGGLLVFGVLPQALAYLSLLILWAHSGKARWLQSRLQAVGRLALTNYLMQSVVCGFVFYGYGLGLYGQLGRVGTTSVVLAVWMLQVLYSPWWVRRVGIGPVEWFWRSLTEGRWYAAASPA